MIDDFIWMVHALSGTGNMINGKIRTGALESIIRLSNDRDIVVRAQRLLADPTKHCEGVAKP